MKIPQAFRNELGSIIGGQWIIDSFDHILARITGTWQVEHLDNGRHGNVTATSITSGQGYFGPELRITGVGSAPDEVPRLTFYTTSASTEPNVQMSGSVSGISVEDEDSAALPLTASVLTASGRVVSFGQMIGPGSGIRLIQSGSVLGVFDRNSSTYVTLKGATLEATTAVVIGAATTAGVRLDIEAGVLAVREGDDSAYGPLKALTLEATSNATIGGTLGVTGAATLSSTLAVTGATTLGDIATQSLIGAGANGVGIGATHASGAIRFYSGGTTERGRFDTNGYFGIGATPTYPLHVANYRNGYLVEFINSYDSPSGGVGGVHIDLSSTSPNDSTHYFIYAEDSTTVRFAVRSNGGIANYSANDVNLSDLGAKNIAGPAPSQRGKLRAIKLYEGKYKDSKRVKDDLMWGAQDIQAIDPAWVDVWQEEERDEDGNVVKPKLLGTRDHVIFLATVGVVSELVKDIDALTARLEALEGKKK